MANWEICRAPALLISTIYSNGLAIPLFLILLAALPAAAHQVKITDNLYVLLHADPNDDPVAGEPARVYFYVRPEGDAAFPVRECNCRVAISKDGESLFSGPLQENDNRRYGSNVMAADIQFPTKGNYEVAITGQNPSNRKSFTLSFNLPIRRGTDLWSRLTELLPAHTLYAVSAGLGVLLLGLYADLRKLFLKKPGPT